MLATPGLVFLSQVVLVPQVWFFATPWTVAHQAPLSLGFPRREHWSGLPFPFAGDLSDQRIEPAAPASTGESLPLPDLVEQEGSYMYYWTRVWLLATKPLELWLVGRKVCFIWLMATEGRWSPLQRLTPLNLTVGGKSFYRKCKGGPCRNSTVNSDCHLEIGHWWSD